MPKKSRVTRCGSKPITPIGAMERRQLNTWIDSWESAERMRRFIAVYAEKIRSRSAEKQPEYNAWIEWATLQADRIDPFVCEKPISVLDRKHELRSW
jgi:hypothetical protein